MPAANPPAEDDRPLILVVDDDPLVQRSIRLILEDEGLAVDSASDAEEALDLARRHRPALVLLDLTLPTAPGEQVAAELHALYGDGVPIVVVTADGHAGAKSRRIGATSYVLKPFEVETLLAAVRRGLATQ